MKHAIGLLEIENVTKGILAADTMLKSGNVELVVAQPMCPGKYIVLVSGDVGAVQSAVRSGQAVAKESVVNDFVLPNVHPSIFPALSGCSEIKQIRALGVIETYSVASAVVAADTAVKAAGVELIEIRLARGLGGKSIISLTGDVGAVSAAIQAGSHVIKESGFLVDQIVIPAPHKGLQASIF
ncbi:BMC domain-containing protein [Heliobacterium chlorum]|uniref:BMC domain-containing protein n=1 Tax=Heliobacterium chlorum TaxID=2698 RepID=A0ABR7SZH4_HELCL|nr:BMC domain-containing protein [Heliobacterium chlorum]MBC9783841.1 BMC domain-containing protein [Heliobacterium chlorum]